MDIDKLAQTILQNNDLGGYTVPNPKLYPFQWNWDSCFVALGFATYDEPRAWQEFEMLFRGQWSNGMIPHIIYHQESDEYAPGPEIYGVCSASGVKTSGLTQPPIAAMCIRKIYEKAEDKELAQKKLQEFFPYLLQYHRWFHTVRDPHQSGLISILHPWESGRDNSPDWDEPLSRVSTENVMDYERKDTNHVDASQRPRKGDYDRYMVLVQNFREHKHSPEGHFNSSSFRVADTTINFILLRSDQDLLVLLDHVEIDEKETIREEIEGWIDRGREGLNRLWNNEHSMFQCLNMLTGDHIVSNSSGGFVAFLTGVLGADFDNALLKKLMDWREKSGAKVPSYDPFSPRYDPSRYWRGPVWAVVNFLIYEGLMLSDHEKYANVIAEDTARFIRQSQFAEYYHPETGEGLGGKDFSWTAAMWLHWLSPLQGKLSA